MNVTLYLLGIGWTVALGVLWALLYSYGESERRANETADGDA